MDDRLPVEDVLPEVAAALAPSGASAVLVAPPGAGKTTLVPLRLLHEPWLGGGRIVVLEPRRLATRAAARRMSVLVGDDVGGLVGYQTRDERHIGPRTRIEVVTEGILTRRLQRDAELPGVALVVFDEVHERNLETDLALAFALQSKALLRPDLRLLAMSATLQAERIATLLGGDGGPAPIITAEGRTFPVDLRWAPPPPKRRLEDAVAATIDRALGDEPGDLLVFLPGIGEIRRVTERLVLPGGVDVRPLAGALSVADQDLALAPSPPGRRRVVLSTDIAETSLTVDGVRVVIDAGQARVPRFDARTGMTRLRTVTASRSSGDQRAGRAGRTEPGVAYRLWSKLENAARRPHLDAEITQVDLAGLALELAVWGVAPSDLAFLDPPPARTLEEGRRLLRLLHALDDDGRVTPVGRAMANLPLHPRLAHMVVVAGERGDGALAVALAALLDERDVLRGRPDDLPADLGLRLTLLADPGERHAAADGRALAGTRRRAEELARRAGISGGLIDPDEAGRVLALAYPDRLAVRRGSAGRFQLRGGTTAWLPATDALATETFLVPADLDGRRTDARIRLAAALAPSEVAEAFGDDVEVRRTLSWDRQRDDLVERVERRLGSMRLDESVRPPAPGPETTAALLERVRATRLAALGWGGAAISLRARLAFLHTHLGAPWPDVSEDALLGELGDWLEPLLAGATGRNDLEAVDMAGALRRRAGRLVGELDRLAPATVELASGRKVALDYSVDPPVLAARVQDLFGTNEIPALAGGRVTVSVHLLSPAGRPVQVTSDLAGFWTGSWHAVRKDMAGRYPKHAWPEDPTKAEPPTGRRS